MPRLHGVGYCHWTIWWNLHQPCSRNTVLSGDQGFLLWIWIHWLCLCIYWTERHSYFVTVKVQKLNQWSSHNGRWKSYRNVCIFNTMHVESNYFPAKIQVQDSVSQQPESATTQPGCNVGKQCAPLRKMYSFARERLKVLAGN